MDTNTGGLRTPRHLWIVGALSLLWNAFGATDYLLTRMGNEAYLSQFTPEQLAYFTAFPFLAGVGWGLGVWGALAGSVLLLMRKRLAVHAFGVSLLGMAISFTYQFGMSDALAVMGNALVGFALVIVAIGVALFFYSRKQAAWGVLR
jgi:hypothetical protein